MLRFIEVCRFLKKYGIRLTSESVEILLNHAIEEPTLFVRGYTTIYLPNGKLGFYTQLELDKDIKIRTNEKKRKKTEHPKRQER